MRAQEQGTAVQATQESWTGIARAAGLGEGLLLAVAAAGLRDLEAAAMAVGAGVAVGLLRFRSGLLGRLGLALLSANVAFWMTSGAVSNLTHGEGFWETALPSALAVAALTALAGAVASMLRMPDGRAVKTVGVIALVVLVAAVAVSAIGIGGRSQARPGDIVLVAEQVKFSETDVAADAGEIGVFVENKDLFWHTFTVRELGVNLNIPVGAERRIAFDAAPGTYRFVCAVPGHTQAGMEGTLTVR